MPELPEVEVTRLSLMSVSAGAAIESCRVYQRQLRYPIVPGFARAMSGNRIIAWKRRSKYLIGELDRGCMLIHLGMSGRLTHSPKPRRAKHDHVVWRLDNGLTLTYNDPRRFGLILYGDNDRFRLLEKIGPEPLSAKNNGAYLRRRCAGSGRNIKNCLMDQGLIAGLGNIYVNEALFLAGIHPLRVASAIGEEECAKLSREIKRVLRRALKAGGTSLRDFAYGDDWPGYFSQSLNVYDRGNLPCPRCGSGIKRIVIANRASYLCPSCQPLTGKRPVSPRSKRN